MYSHGTRVDAVHGKAVNTSGPSSLMSVFQGDVCACHCCMKISLYDFFEYLDLKFFLATKTKWWKEKEKWNDREIKRKECTLKSCSDGRFWVLTKNLISGRLRGRRWEGHPPIPFFMSRNYNVKKLKDVTRTRTSINILPKRHLSIHRTLPRGLKTPPVWRGFWLKNTSARLSLCGGSILIALWVWDLVLLLLLLCGLWATFRSSLDGLFDMSPAESCDTSF